MQNVLAAGAWPAAVAVSGGGDSIALMHLLARWAKTYRKPAPVVLTVDHGLRDRSARDAKVVVARARALGLSATVLRWKGPHPTSGIEAAAREARYRLMGAWLTRHRIATLYVGHSEDDQAETFLLRLARGSGVDGLAAMRPLSSFPDAAYAGLTLARPLLGVSRDALRAYLEALGEDWLEDPMNDDPRFDRVKLRRLAPALAEAGLSPRRIAAAAAHLAAAREALEVMTEAVLARTCRQADKALLLDASALVASPRAIGLRALAAVLQAVSGEPYRPRFASLERLFDRIASGTLGGGATLSGCRVGPALARERVFGPATLKIAAERPRAVRRPVAGGG